MSIAISMRMDGDLKMWRETTNSAGTKQNTYGRLTDEQRSVWDAYFNRIMRELDEARPEGAFFLGEHGWFDKRFMYEISYRTPLLIRWPNVIQPHSVNTDIVSNLDFAQTFLDAAGIPQPDDMQGSNLIPLLKGTTPADWRKEHYYHYHAYPDWHMVKRHYGIADERYKLIHFYFDIDEWELYDLEKDPNEMRNVCNDPAYVNVREDMHKRLLALREKYGDSDELMNSFLPEYLEKEKRRYVHN